MSSKLPPTQLDAVVDLDAREAAIEEREAAVAKRERSIRMREQAIAKDDDEANDLDRVRLLAQMREANEKLVLATLHAQQLAEEATAARAAAASSEVVNRAKDEFLAMLGHELRNPLTPIVVALELMERRNPNVSEVERGMIERQVAHMIRLVDDLLDVSRLSRGKITLYKQHIELSDAVVKAIEMVRPLLDQRTHALFVDVPPTGFPLFADPIRLAQVVSNLLTNAVKYTNKGGKISVIATRDGDMIRLRVSDNGMGIEPAA